MPGFDGTGPRGQGAMTGGARGYCAVSPGGTRRGGLGGRSGGGRGRRHCFYATGLPGWLRAQKGMQAFGGSGRGMTAVEELEVLQNHADVLKQQLEQAQARIQALTNRQETDTT